MPTTGTAYGRMMDELVHKLNDVVQHVASDADKHNRLCDVVATILSTLKVHEKRLDAHTKRLDVLETAQRLENPLRTIDYGAPTYGPPNYGDGVYPNVQPHSVSLLRAQLSAAATLLHTARDCIKQCLALATADNVGFAFAGSLTEVDVAYWMQENPSQCLGGFDLTRLRASIASQRNHMRYGSIKK